MEGKGEDWHGHVTALSVAASFRSCGVGRQLMRCFEDTCERVFCCHFSDLFVRPSNEAAIGLYEGLGYSTFRRVPKYYSGKEDALDMRKSLHPPSKTALPHKA